MNPVGTIRSQCRDRRTGSADPNRSETDNASAAPGGIGRRAFLGGAASLLAFPHVPAKAAVSDTAVVIVGAGAAGLAAAQTFRAAGIPFRLIEIRDRVGGRAFTDTDYFGVPVDIGCSELHHARLNPWMAYARQNGFAVAPLPDDDENAIFDGDRRLDEREKRDLARAFARHQRLLARSCGAARDMSVAEAVASLDGDPWSPSIRLWLGPITSGVDLEDWSVREWCGGASGENWYAPAGFGRLVAHSGRALPVTLNTRVSEIRWSGKGVTVITNNGELTAKAVVVTVPVAVLQEDFIRFRPSLPARLTRALDGMVIANYIRVLLQFDRDIFGQEDGSWIASRTAGRDGFSFWVNPGGHGVTHAIAGGRFAVDLELSGADEAVDAALGVLRALLGEQAGDAFVDGTASVWHQDPFARGAWAQAKPGHAASRRELIKPLAGRVYFAGEANHDRLWATAGGATLVGRAVAKHISSVIDRL